MSTHTVFILKVLKGINAGASVRLKTGSVVIGRNMSSDIILHDENIADQHLQLLITPANITLQPLVQPVFVDEEEVAIEGIELRPYQTVRLGNVEFTISDGSGGQPNRQTQKSAQGHNGISDQFSKRQPAADGRMQALWQKKKGNINYLLGGLALWLLGNALVMAPYVQPWLTQAGISRPAETQAVTLLANLGQQHVAFNQQADGVVRVQGYTLTTKERNELLNKLHQAGIQANVRIWSQEEMLENAGIIARSLGESNVQFTLGKSPEQLLVQGFVSTKQVWERIKTAILEDVGGVDSIDESQLNSTDNYLAAFMQFVDQNGLSSRLNVASIDKRIIVKGELTQPEIEKLQGLHRDFIRIQGAGPDIVLNVTDIKTRIKLAIRSVSVGKVPFLVSKDGKKYMEGSSLGENYFIKAIKPDHVILTTAGIEIPFYYAIEAGKNDVANRTSAAK